MAITVVSLIDQAQLVSNNRRNAAISQTDWVTFINWAVESWYKFRISLDPSLYFAQRDVTLVGGIAASTIDLTTGFTPGVRALHGVDVNPDTGSRYTLRSRNFRQRNESVGGWIPTTWCPVRFYDVRAMSLVVTPYEAAAGVYRVYYRGKPYQFVSAIDAVPLDAVLEPESEAIVKLAACSALGIEETSDDPWVKRINAIKAEVQAAYERDDGQAFQIADVEDLGWPLR